ncbi:hypothetical protein ANCDUO_23749 [Ancylostoma duodenale]|uniref:Integrase zinc-binding domain-containing protein n=1 Tax=Ancylostoma duodenale TaxID=51022 RepID=A0A0C2C8W9_9BILA|nr:hypothetical protein ANCDUO_23749 [Ancylostoma duodenale]
MYGRDPIFNIDLLIKHDLQRHIPSDEDAGVYVENLVSTLHAAWRSAAAFNERQSRKFKQQYDRSHLQPLEVKVGDRVFLRDFIPKLGLSQKLVNPWLGQFRVIVVDPPHLIITSISSPQSTPKKVHMNQVKKCFELTGPVFTSPWSPEQETQELAAANAVDSDMCGYRHEVVQQIEQPVSESSHSYNTRFRSRRTSI